MYNKFIQITGEFRRYNNPNQVQHITIKDSYRFIPMALSELGECCRFEVGKEIMPYEIYTEDNVLKEYVPITEAIEAMQKSIEHKHYSSEKQEKDLELAIAQLIKSIDSWDCKENDEFNILELTRQD